MLLMLNAVFVLDDDDDDDDGPGCDADGGDGEDYELPTILDTVKIQRDRVRVASPVRLVHDSVTLRPWEMQSSSSMFAEL